jgi:hypothetical protein
MSKSAIDFIKTLTLSPTCYTVALTLVIHAMGYLRARTDISFMERKTDGPTLELACPESLVNPLV